MDLPTGALTLRDLLTRNDILEVLSTRDNLLAHGVRLFHRCGVQGTSIGKLLETAGKSKSQFYFHFKDKDDFTCHVLDWEMSTLLRRKSRHRLGCLEDLEDWFSPYLELAMLPGNLGCPIGTAATEMSPSSDVIRAEAMRQLARWEEKIADDLIVLAAREGFDSTFEPLTTARTLVCSIQGAFLMGRVYRDPNFILAVKDSLRRDLERRRDQARANSR